MKQNRMIVLEAQAKSCENANFHTLALEFDRLWRAALKGTKAEVAGMIMDRTIRYGKLWEVISLSHMCDGVWDHAGRFIHAGLNACRRAIITALDELVEQGVVLRREVNSRYSSGYEYSINWSFDIMGMLPTPKRDRATRNGLALPKPKDRSTSAEFAQEPVQNLHQTSAEFAPSNIDTNIDNNMDRGEQSSRLSGQGSIAETIRGVKERAERHLQKRRDRAGTLTPERFERDWWKPCWTENSHGAVYCPLSPKERGQAKHLIKELGEQKLKDVVEWCLANWHMVRQAKFPKARGVDFPDTPVFSFFFAFRQAFIAVYNDREAAERLATNPKAALIQYFRRRGMTLDQAIEAAGEEERLSQREKALREREANVARAARVVERTVQQQGGRVRETATAEEVKARLAARKSEPRFTEADEPANYRFNISEWK